MTLLKAHRLLIASGIAVCLLFACREIWHAANTSALVTFLRVGISILIAIALVLYLRTVRLR